MFIESLLDSAIADEEAHGTPQLDVLPDVFLSIQMSFRYLFISFTGALFSGFLSSSRFIILRKRDVKERNGTGTFVVFLFCQRIKLL
jgi:hypothetical protein